MHACFISICFALFQPSAYGSLVAANRGFAQAPSLTIHVMRLRQLPQLLRSSFGAPAGGVLVLLSMHGITLRYVHMARISLSVMD
jgi:hypothetical protein